MSAMATPAIPNPFESASAQAGRTGPLLGLIAVTVWVAVLAGQIALSGSGVRVCHGTTEALRQLVSVHV